MIIEFYNDYNEDFNIYENEYLRITEDIFKKLEIKNNYFIEVNLINNDKIKSINKEYRNIDSSTDVISFAYLDEIEGETKIIGDIPLFLGCIYISCDKAKEQACSYGHLLDREMKFLFVHGMLHLLGYDHIEKEDEEKMFALQEELLKGEKYE